MTPGAVVSLTVNVNGEDGDQRLAVLRDDRPLRSGTCRCRWPSGPASRVKRDRERDHRGELRVVDARSGVPTVDAVTPGGVPVKTRSSTLTVVKSTGWLKVTMIVPGARVVTV